MTMSLLFVLLGAALLCLVLLDLIVTTLTMDGVGPVSNWVAYATSAAFRQLKRIHPRVAMVSGPVTLTLVILFWVVATWAGWALVFSWDAVEIVRTSTGKPANWLENIYYAGFTITTIGYGDFRANSGLGQVLSIIAGINGVSLLTLGLTYSNQVLTALIEKRQLAVMIEALEPTVLQCDTECEDELKLLASELAKLDADIAGVSQKYLAYPVIHFFHDRTRQVSLPLKIALLHRCLSDTDQSKRQVPRKLAVQIKKTQTLVRILVVNALKSHWSSGYDAQTETQSHDPIQHQHQGTEALETLLMTYVESAGWNWEKDVNAPDE